VGSLSVRTVLRMLDFLISSLILGIPMAYILRALILEEKVSHEGPFRSPSKTVVFYVYEWRYNDGSKMIIKRLPEPEESHRQKVAMFDWIRRLFGVYEIVGNEWKVRDHWLTELWTCPFCLSFWVSFLFSVPFSIIGFGLTVDALLYWPVAHFSIAVVSQMIYKRLFD